MTVEDYKKQFELVWSGVPWYGIPFEKTLNDLNENYVFRKDSGFTHSIAEVLVHVNAWRINLLQMLSGNGDYAINPDSELDWSRQVSEKSWTEIMAETRKLQQEVLKALEATSDELLLETVPGREYKYDYLINGVIQHDVYHLGQIRQMYRFYENS